jgi:hypothetical protein
MNLAAFGAGKLLVPANNGANLTREAIKNSFKISIADLYNVDYAVKATLISYLNNTIIDFCAKKAGNIAQSAGGCFGYGGGFGGAKRSVMMCA